MTGALVPSFSRGLKRMIAGDKLAPILHAELMSPSFTGFSIKVEKWTDRPPDGWFHPSTHALWPARKLALYLTHPDKIEEEPDSFERTLAVTQGHFFHTFTGKLFKRNGIMQLLEIPTIDPLHRRKGHMDGLMATHEGWEFKTVNQPFLLKRIVDVASLREYKPGYYAQMQDYMDMLGLTAMRFLMMGVFYPYPMVEFQVMYDEPFQLAQRRKYVEALERADGGELPEACCAPRSKEAKACAMRLACPVGRAALRLV